MLQASVNFVTLLSNELTWLIFYRKTNTGVNNNDL